MLASKIEDFSKLWPSKRPSKIHRFSHRFFIDFGSVLASNMGSSWGPRRLQIRKNGLQKVFRSPPLLDLNTICLQNIVLDGFGIDFKGSGLDFLRFLDDFSSFLAYFGHVFGCSCWWPGGMREAKIRQIFNLFLDDFSNFLAYFGHVFGCSCWGGLRPPRPPRS